MGNWIIEYNKFFYASLQYLLLYRCCYTYSASCFLIVTAFLILTVLYSVCDLSSPFSKGLSVDPNDFVSALPLMKGLPMAP